MRIDYRQLTSYLKAVVRKQHETMKEQADEIAALKNRNELLDDENFTLAEKMIEIKDVNDDLVDVNDKLTDDNITLVDENIKLVDENVRLIDKNTELADETAALDKVVAKLKYDYDIMKNAAFRLTATNAELKEESDELTVENDNLAAELYSYLSANRNPSGITFMPR